MPEATNGGNESEGRLLKALRFADGQLLLVSGQDMIHGTIAFLTK